MVKDYSSCHLYAYFLYWNKEWQLGWLGWESFSMRFNRQNETCFPSTRRQVQKTWNNLTSAIDLTVSFPITYCKEWGRNMLKMCLPVGSRLFFSHIRTKTFYLGYLLPLFMVMPTQSSWLFYSACNADFLNIANNHILRKILLGYCF